MSQCPEVARKVKYQSAGWANVTFAIVMQKKTRLLKGLSNEMGWFHEVVIANYIQKEKLYNYF